MKKSIIYSIMLLMSAMGFVSCENDFEYPPMVVPEAPAGMTRNISIAELKTLYWQDARNYCTEIGVNEATGEDYIIEGRVVSSDESGNIYKNFIIEDETGAIAISVNMKKIYSTYKYGQNVVVNVTGLHIGKYNGLQQLGKPEWYEAGQTYETTFMDEETLLAHAFQNGLPDVNKVVPEVMTIPEIAALKSNTADIIKWTSRLVRINNVRWEDAGTEFAGTANANRYVVDSDGNRMLFRNSAYSSFSYEKLPWGYGDVIGILSFYGTDWQMLLIDQDGLVNYDPEAGPEDVPGMGKYKKVSAVTSGKQYLILAGNQMAKSLAADKTYGWLYVSEVAPENDELIASDDNSFIFTQTTDGYTIQQASDSRYLYMEGTFNSFQLAADITSDNAAWWDVAANADGTFTITNKGMAKWMQFSPSFSSFGAYSSAQDNGVLPSLYEKQ